MNNTLSEDVSVNYSSNASSSAIKIPPDIKIYANVISFVFQTVYLAIGAIGITGNLLALIVFLWHKPLLRRPANYYLVSQCTINLLVSIMLILTIMIDGNNWPASVLVPMCHLWNSRALFIGLFMAALYNITVMTIERYLEVVYPIQHRLKVSNGKVIVSIVAGAVFGIFFKLCIGCPTVKVVDGICTSAAYASVAAKRIAGVANFLVEYFIPIAVFTFCYAGMALSLRRLSKVTQTASDTLHSTDPKISRARRNIIKTLFIVVLAFVICSSFKEFLLSMTVFGDVPLDLSGLTYNVSLVLSYLNCCNDPFIYAFHYEEFRVGLRKLFCRFKVRPSYQSGASTTQTEVSKVNQPRDTK